MGHLALDRTARQSGHDVLLQKQEQNHHRSCQHQYGGRQRRPIAPVYTLENDQAARDRIIIFIRQVDRRGDDLVPNSDRMQNDDRCDRGTDQRENDRHNETEITATL